MHCASSADKLNKLRCMNIYDLKDALLQQYQINLEPQFSWIKCLVITSDNKYAFYISEDGILRRWSIEENLQTPFVNTIFSARQLIITNDDKYIIIFTGNT